jgi:hypothetical protein
VVEKAKQMKLAPLTERGIQSMIAGQQRSSRRSRVHAVARATGFSDDYLTQITGESLPRALARGIAISPWDSLPLTGGVRAMGRAFEDIEDEVYPVLDLDAWRKRACHKPSPSTERDREEFTLAAAKVLHLAFKQRTPRHEALKGLKAWLEESSKP